MHALLGCKNHYLCIYFSEEITLRTLNVRFLMDDLHETSTVVAAIYSYLCQDNWLLQIISRWFLFLFMYLFIFLFSIFAYLIISFFIKSSNLVQMDVKYLIISSNLKKKKEGNNMNECSKWQLNDTFDICLTLYLRCFHFFMTWKWWVQLYLKATTTTTTNEKMINFLCQCIFIFFTKLVYVVNENENV